MVAWIWIATAFLAAGGGLAILAASLRPRVARARIDDAGILSDGV
jgi:cephalosporin-C deacetylase-like acetyl esterase